MDTPTADPLTPANQMIGSSVFTDAAEFHAIGLRPMEFRPGVIRRAMNRSATPLANQHLTEPTVDLEARLARVVMTGYRLLDPRRREDSIQRMMLGRIHPQLADEAARMAQSQGNQAIFGQGTDGDSETMLERGLIGSQSGKHANRYFLHDPVSESLRSHNLLIERSPSRFARLPKKITSVPSVAAGTILSALLLMSFAWGWWSQDSSTSATSSHQQSVQQASVLPQANEVPAVQEVAKNVAKVSPVVGTPVVGEIPLTNAASATDLASANASAAMGLLSAESLPTKDASATNTLPPHPNSNPALNINTLPTAPALLADLAELPIVVPEPIVATSTLVPSTSEVDASIVVDTSDKGNSVDMVDQSEAQQAALEASIPVIQPIAPVAVSEAIALSDAPSPPKRHAVPQATDLAASIAQWEATQQDLLPNDLPARLIRSLEFAGTAAASANVQAMPVNTWVGLQAAIRYAVLQGRFDEADQSIARLTSSFDTDDFALALAVSEQLKPLELTPSTMANVLQWAEIWAGRSLLVSRFEEAITFTELMEALAESADDKPAIARSADFEKSIATAKRLMSTVTDLEASAQSPLSLRETSPSDHYAVGRYWALVRRDWAKAIPHLMKGSDVRLASIASMESALSDAPTPEQLTTVAVGYASLAEKTNGWLRASYLVHANEILSRKASEENQAASLELTRYRKQFQAEHEPVFASTERLLRAQPNFDSQKLAIPGSTFAPGTLGNPGSDAPAFDEATKPLRGLAGRIEAEGIDIGAELTVEPGASITRKAFDQIASRLDVNLATAKMRLSGVITIDQPTAVVIHLTNLGDSRLQSIFVDKKEILPIVENVSNFDSELVYRVDLSRGTWTLHWIAPAIAGRDLTFRVTDGLSGMPLTVETPVQTAEKQGNDLPTRLRVTVIAGQ